MVVSDKENFHFAEKQIKLSAKDWFAFNKTMDKAEKMPLLKLKKLIEECLVQD